MKSYVFWNRWARRPLNGPLASSDAAIAFLPYEKRRQMLFAQADSWVPFRGRVGRRGLRRLERLQAGAQSRKAGEA